MKQTVLDVLIYLFENYIDDDIDFSVDRALLQKDLTEAGFDDGQVVKAFDWLQTLASQAETGGARRTGERTIRVFTSEEEDKLDVECRGFLLLLEQIGVLDPHGRELVLDRVMALESDDIDLEQLKWVILMVLFNQPGHEDAFVWMEDLVLDELGGSLH